MPTPLELRLHDLAAAFARRIAKMIGELTIEELAALCDEGDAPVAKAPRKKAKPGPKARPKAKARRKAKAAAKGGPRTVVVVDGPQEPQGPSMSSMQSMSSLGAPAPPQSRHSPQGDGGPPPEDRAAAFLRSERERLETAVLKFVGQNPGTDAEIVAVRVGMPKGKAQGLLDDLVLRGKLRMKSGQHGRCYVGVERG